MSGTDDDNDNDDNDNDDNDDNDGTVYMMACQMWPYCCLVYVAQICPCYTWPRCGLVKVATTPNISLVFQSL